MIAESVSSKSNLTEESFDSTHKSISQLYQEVPESLVVTAPESKMLYFKGLSYSNPESFTSEFEKFIEASLVSTQKNKILLFLGKKIEEVTKQYEKSKAETSAKTFVSRVLREEDLISYWNASLNPQELWACQDRVMPDGPVYFRGLLGGLNDQLVYNLEKSYAKRWEVENNKKIEAAKALEKENNPEGKEEQVTEAPHVLTKFNIDYFSWVLQHREFSLTGKDIIDMDIDKIKDAYIFEQ